MGTCYFLQREDGKLFDLDKAYGINNYVRGEVWDCNGQEWDIGTDVDALMALLAEIQPYPDEEWGRRFAEDLIWFAQGKPVRVYSEYTIDEDIEWDDHTIAWRFPVDGKTRKGEDGGGS